MVRIVAKSFCCDKFRSLRSSLAVVVIAAKSCNADHQIYLR